MSWKAIRNLHGLFNLSLMSGVWEHPVISQLIEFVRSDVSVRDLALILEAIHTK